MAASQLSFGSITLAFRQLREGDRAAVQALWDRFMPRLMGLARTTLSAKAKRLADPDDIVQNAFLSFLEHVETGRVSGDLHRDALWRYLATITRNKALNQHRDEVAAKRGGGWIQELGSELSVKVTPEATGVAALSPQEFDTFADELLESLDDELRAIAILKLAGFDNREIAEALEVVERTIQRKLALIGRLWESQMQA